MERFNRPKKSKSQAFAAQHGAAPVSTAQALMKCHGQAFTSDQPFNRILPSAMKRLVDEGLSEPHEGSYRITPKGRKLLSKLQFLEGLDG